MINILYEYINFKNNFNIDFNKLKLKISNNIYLKFNNNIKNKIKIALYSSYIGNGGRARISTILLNYLNKIKLFNLYLFTNIKQKNEYCIPNNTKRIIIQNNLFKVIKENEIDILIYQQTNISEINKLNII